LGRTSQPQTANLEDQSRSLKIRVANLVDFPPDLADFDPV